MGEITVAIISGNFSIPLKYFHCLTQDTTGQRQVRGGILKLLRSPGIDSIEYILSAYVARRACTTTLFLLGAQPPYIVLKFQH
jgi:hypothetical protein